ncbi:glycerophosphodiester phosphodiesterase family protein [Microbacterium indicum]|uniref:glycerophosphodiester phosphodiesterase family protein n=1 Tax=Microbacterium indicum TaxID=358100 RepID=UPI0004039372|nr:glycerophosphodiester phosphodiesterase family protein [Microbacterium indicum]
MSQRSPRMVRLGAAGIAAAAILAGCLAAPPALAQTGDAPAAADEAGDVLVSESFDSGEIPDGWTVAGGSWSVEDGALVGTSGSEDAKILFGRSAENFSFDVDVTFEKASDSARWLALVLDARADGSVPWQHAALRNGSNAANGVEFAQRTAQSTWNVTDTGSTADPVGIGNTAHLRVEVHGNQGTWYVDGQEIMSTRQLARTADGVQGLIANSSTVRYDNVEVREIDPLPPIALKNPGETGIVAAHRGNSSMAPENTMPAFVAATRAGSDYFEIDIDMTSDGVPVVIHDDTVDRTTDGTGRVRDLTYDEIRSLDAGSWFSPAYAGTQIPSLEEVLTYVENGGADLLLEYKGDWTTDEAQVTLDMIEEHGVAQKVFAQSFSQTTVANLAQVAPDLTLGWLVGGLDQATIDRTVELGADAVNPSGPTAETVAAAHAAGLGVFTWTKDTAGEWQQLTAMGVDGIITNRPDQLVGWNLRYNQGGGAPEEPEQPEPGEQPIAVTIPDAVQPSGEFTWRLRSQDVVSLGTATALGDSYVASGVLNDIEITDTRANPAGTWTLTGQASPFRAGDDEFDASALGWTPEVRAEGAGAAAGEPAVAGSGGLAEASVLASAASDEYKGAGTAVVGAGLSLRLPLGQEAGDYTSTLSVTAIQ